MGDVPIDCDFPVWGLMPKKETGVVSFLNKHPEYDGRGTIIAILDSGVDPAAEGLKVTSTGEPKVIERFDCSGCGDVDTSTVRKLVDGHLIGITGRNLKVPETWENPTNTWRLGVLYPYSIYPTKVKERMVEHRKEHLWDVGQKPCLAEATKKLQEFEAEVVAKNPTLSVDDKMMKEELEARVEALQSAEKKYNDHGPTYDCVLFHDGTVYRACIDTSESGELSSGVLLGEYGATREHAHLTPVDEMTVSINVHDDGNTLEVVGMCSTHGTHVASIAAGCFPDEPDRNGAAPGAQLVSLTIGDSRLGSMETGAALVRACIKVMEMADKRRVDVINMSYGEHAHWSNAGRIGDVISTVVNRYGVSWVVSAGNHGPALGTVGAPPDIAQPVLIGVGAYVSCEMMSAAYSMRARASPGAFSWSSRGPCADGALGIAVVAPGGAVASVARFTLRNSQLMNGTSMAAPHVAGAVSALISGLKAKDIPYSPYSMKRALENSATYLSHVEPWAQGCGLLNVEKAFDILTAYHAQPERDVVFRVQCGGGAGAAGGGKGVFVRARADEPPRDVPVTVEPQFRRDHRDAHDTGVIAKQIEFGMRVALSCTAPWLSAPAHVQLMNAPRPLAVRLDFAALPPGAHFASIDAYDVSCVEKGPVFRVPLTVLRPSPVGPAASPYFNEADVLFQPGTIKRHFIIVPADATWGVLRLSARDPDATGRFLVHAMQLLPRRSCRCHETQKMLNVTADAPTLLHFPVVGGIMLEMVIAKYWANLGDVRVDYTVELHGLRPDFGPRLHMGAGALGTVLLSALRPQEVQPSAQLKYCEPVLRPTESKIAPLTRRDVIPPSKQIYQLINTYTFSIAKATEVSPMVSLLCDMLYESEFESQMWMLFNSCKQLMAVGDAYPVKYCVKLEKGEYTLRLGVRHDSRALLERLQELPVALQQRLPQPITLDAYCDQAQALTSGKKFTTGSLASGNLLPLYFTPVSTDKACGGRGGRGGAGGAHALTGTVSFARDEAARRVAVHPLTLAPCEPRRAANSSGGGGAAARAAPFDEYTDAARDLVLAWLPKLEGDKLEAVYEEAVARYPRCAGVHVAYLHALDPPSDHKKLPHANQEPEVTAAWCEQLISISDKAIKLIDQEKLLAYLGMKNDSRSDAAKIKQEQERQRGYLVEALCRRGAALCRLHAGAHSGAAREKIADALRTNMADLLKFTDITDAKAIQYGVWQWFTLRQWGRAARLLARLADERPSRELDERLAEAYRELGWDHCARHTQNSLPIRYPATYRPF